MLDVKDMQWIYPPKQYSVTADEIIIKTEPHTDLWQRTYYGFCNDNAPMLQLSTKEEYFSFSVKTQFATKRRFDQCGIVMYLDSDNWLKASIEYQDGKIQRLGSVVTNHGYSDWATTDIPSDVDTMWYRLSRRGSDYCIECSYDGVEYRQISICHVWEDMGEVRFGVYACSPEDSSFEAKFSLLKVSQCKWLAHQ